MRIKESQLRALIEEAMNEAPLKHAKGQLPSQLVDDCANDILHAVNKLTRLIRALETAGATPQLTKTVAAKREMLWNLGEKLRSSLHRSVDTYDVKRGKTKWDV